MLSSCKQSVADCDARSADLISKRLPDTQRKISVRPLDLHLHKLKERKKKDRRRPPVQTWRSFKPGTTHNNMQNSCKREIPPTSPPLHYPHKHKPPSGTDAL